MAILNLLVDGQFHSGEALGASLGISRAAVSKQMSVWRDLGVELDVVRNKGYRLRQPFELLDETRIRSHLKPSVQAMLQGFILKQETTSTNDELLRQLKAGCSHLLCLAERQTAGRGRRGREWVSPYGCNFYGSFSWTFERGFGALEGLSLAVGVAVARALKSYGVEHVGLKWPNDLMIGPRKLGGVLIEVQGEGGGPCDAIIGIGVNFWLSPAHEAGIDKEVVSLYRYFGDAVRRNELAAGIINEVVLLLSEYEADGFASVVSEWRQLDVYRGQRVSITQHQGVIEGVAEGVDESGALLLRVDDGLLHIAMGEVSLRAVSHV